MCYFGPCNEYITLLLGLRQQAEKAVSDIQVYIGCRDELYGPKQTVPESVITKMIREPWSTAFGHIREIRYNMIDHPVEKFFKDSNIEIVPIEEIQSDLKTIQIYTQASDEKYSMTSKTIEEFIKEYEKRGYSVELNGDWTKAGCVLGVESVKFWEATLAGKKMILYDIGKGGNLFRSICPNGKIISR